MKRPVSASSSKVDGVLPLHRQVEQAIRRLVANPKYSGGELLPDELTIANRFGVSRGTARTALARLVTEGILERRAGVGTRVVQRQAESAISAWRSFSREMARKGIEVQVFGCSLRDVAAPEVVAQALRLKKNEMVQRVDRVRGWDDVPVLQSRSWLHPRARLPQDADLRRPLYDLVAEASGLTPDRAHEAFAAVTASATLAKSLQVAAGSPLLLRQHTVFDAGGRAMEYSEVHYVSERFTLTLDLRKDQVT